MQNSLPLKQVIWVIRVWLNCTKVDKYDHINIHKDAKTTTTKQQKYVCPIQPQPVKTCLQCLPITKVLIRLCIHTAWSAPMLFIYWNVSYLNAIFFFNFLARLCSWEEVWVWHFVVNSERRFCCVEANISILNEHQINSLLLGNISCLSGCLLTIFQNWLSKNSFRNTVRV